MLLPKTENLTGNSLEDPAVRRNVRTKREKSNDQLISACGIEWSRDPNGLPFVGVTLATPALAWTDVRVLRILIVRGGLLEIDRK